MEFPGVSSSQGNWLWKFLGRIKKEMKFPGVIKENSGGISMGVGFWPWSLQEGCSVTQFCGILRREALLCP